MDIESITIKEIRDFYIDWVNNWLTTKGISDNYGIDENTAVKLINLGRIIHNHLINIES